MKTILLLAMLFSFVDPIPTIIKGTVSYYGQHWTGRKTASGETFYADSLTCAHKTYKFGTLLKLTNLKNDSVIFVKVNDRLPKSSHFIADLSYGCAKKLNFVKLSRSTIWKDAGTFDSLIESGNIIKNVQEQDFIKIALLEEISIRNKWIDKSKILKSIKDKHLRDYLKKI
jgi:rare lipoprotein A